MSFGDVRVDARAEWLIDRVAATGSLVLRRLGETRAGEMAVHRFLSSPYVSVERIVETLAARTAAACAGRPVLLVQDTSEINFSGRDKKRRGFGPAGDGKTAGYFLHPVILDACFQLLLAVEPPQNTGSAHVANQYMPVGVGQIRVNARPQATMWAHARLAETAGQRPGQSLAGAGLA